MTGGTASGKRAGGGITAEVLAAIANWTFHDAALFEAATARKTM